MVSTPTTNLTVAVAGVAGLAVVVGAIWFGMGDAQSLPAENQSSVVVSALDTSIRVHVSGAVVSPGVVKLATGAIVADAVRAAGGATPSADLTAINLASIVRGGERILVPDTNPSAVNAAPTPNAGIDLNLSSVSDLEGLPGVGPVLAKRIVDFREEYGAFSTVEDLLDVPGIGEAKLALMRDAISRP